MACGIYFPDQGSNLGPLHWEHGVLATGPPGKCPNRTYFELDRTPSHQFAISALIGHHSLEQYTLCVQIIFLNSVTFVDILVTSIMWSILLNILIIWNIHSSVVSQIFENSQNNNNMSTLNKKRKTGKNEFGFIFCLSLSLPPTHLSDILVGRRAVGVGERESWLHPKEGMWGSRAWFIDWCLKEPGWGGHLHHWLN